jgi:uncharacterized membrane protein YcaP (DUF421 family)
VLEALNLWSGWPRLFEVGLSAFLFYVLIVVLSRVIGKRTTSELNNFDWIINVTIGSLAASGILLEDVSTIDATLAIIVIAACQFITTWVVLRSERFSRIVKSSPTLLTHKGEFLHESMRRTRVSEDEIRAALREAGILNLKDCNWVVLETNGKLTVIPSGDSSFDEADAMSGVLTHKDFEACEGRDC